MTSTLRIGIVGAGNIADRYAKSLAAYPHADLSGITDMDLGKAEALAAAVGTDVYADLNALLADVDLVVNLTIHHAHYGVTRQCLEAGRHVYSEKPLAMTYREAHDLVELAGRRGVRLSCSPFTFMGEAQQTAWKHIRDGAIGEVRLVYAEVNWGRIESWHPNPAPFYEVGVLFDVGVYPLTLLTTMFGPARRVTSHGRILYPDRATEDGTPFHLTTPDFILSLVELESGALVRLTTDFYAPFHSKQTGLELHGDTGSIYLSRWDSPDATVELSAPFNEAYRPLPLLRPAESIDWGVGVKELVEAIRDDRPQRVTGAQAAHVVEILEAAHASLERGGAVEIRSGFTPPQPLEWAL